MLPEPARRRSVQGREKVATGADRRQAHCWMVTIDPRTRSKKSPPTAWKSVATATSTPGDLLRNIGFPGHAQFVDRLGWTPTAGRVKVLASTSHRGREHPAGPTNISSRPWPMAWWRKATTAVPTLQKAAITPAESWRPWISGELLASSRRNNTLASMPVPLFLRVKSGGWIPPDSGEQGHQKDPAQGRSVRPRCRISAMTRSTCLCRSQLVHHVQVTGDRCAKGHPGGGKHLHWKVAATNSMLVHLSMGLRTGLGVYPLL